MNIRGGTGSYKLSSRLEKIADVMNLFFNEHYNQKRRCDIEGKNDYDPGRIRAVILGECVFVTRKAESPGESG